MASMFGWWTALMDDTKRRIRTPIIPPGKARWKAETPISRSLGTGLSILVDKFDMFNLADSGRYLACLGGLEGSSGPCCLLSRGSVKRDVQVSTLRSHLPCWQSRRSCYKTIQ